jgi:Mg-chelatase subunit ChlD
LKSYSDGQHQWVKQTHSKNTLFVVIDCELAEEKYLITYLKDLAKTIQSNAINLSNRFNICIQHFNCIKDK